jgi:hypothetical protein
LICLFACAVAGPVRADDKADADAAFREGRKALTAGNLAVACPLFEKSLLLDKAAGTALNLGDCEERAGRLADAVVHYKLALQIMAPNDDRRAITTQRVAAAEPRVPRLTVRLSANAPPKTRVLRNGVEVDRSLLGAPQQVNPGSYSILVDSEGRTTRKYDTVLLEGQAVDLEVEPGPAPGEAPAVAPAPAPAAAPTAAPAPATADTKPPKPKQQLRPTTIAAFAVGGAGLVVGAVTGIMALSAAGTVHDHCPGGVCASQDDYDAAGRARTLGLVSTLAFGAGLIATGVGVWDLTRKPQVRAGAVVGPRSATLSVMADF